MLKFFFPHTTLSLCRKGVLMQPIDGWKPVMKKCRPVHKTKIMPKILIGILFIICIMISLLCLYIEYYATAFYFFVITIVLYYKAKKYIE